MDVVIRVLGRVDLKNEVNMLKINASRDDISSKEDSIALAKKVLDDSLSSSGFEFSVDAVDVVLGCWQGGKVKVQQFCVVVHTGAGAEEDDDLGCGHFFVKEADEEVDLFESIIHCYVGILQAFRDDIAFEFLWLDCRRVFDLGVDGFEADLRQIPHAEELEVLLLHALQGG